MNETSHPAPGESPSTQLTPCPHCGGRTALVARPAKGGAGSARAAWVCGACGGPRVPGTSGENRALARARVAEVAAFAWSAGAFVAGIVAASAAALGAILWGASHVAGGILGGLAALLLVMALRASMSARARRREAARELDEGWREGALSILRARGANASAAELARTMRIEEDEADALLSELSAHERVRLDVGDEGRVSYRVATDAREADEEQAGEGAGTREEKR